MSLGKEIDNFVITLTLNASNIGKEIQKAAKDVAAGTKTIEAETQRLGGKINNLIQTTQLWVRGFYAFTAAMGVAFYQYRKEADELGRTAQDIGIGVDTLNALEMSVDRAGNSTKDLEKDMQKLAETTGGSAYGALMELAQTAEEMSEADFKNYAEELGISRATIDLTKGGTQALKDEIHAMKEMGVITKEDSELAKQFNRGMKDIWASFRGVANIVFRMVLPYFNKFLEIGKNIMLFLRKHERFVQLFFIGIAAAIMNFAIPAFALLAKMILANPITWLVGLIAVLALILEDLVVWAEEGDAAFADLWEALLGSPKEAMEKWENLKNSVNKLSKAATDAFDAIGQTIDIFVNIAKSILGSFFDWVSSGFSKIGQAMGAFLEKYASQGRALTGGAVAFSAEQVDAASQAEGAGRADGGIFTSPTHALLGEAGAEAIIPFSPGKKNRGLELLSKIAGNFMDVSASQALPMGGATTNNITTDTRVNVGSVTINAADGTDAANQFMTGIETRASAWTAAANAAY